MLIRTLTLDDPAWNEALARTPHDVYHTPDYVRAEARRMQAEGEAIAVSEGDAQLFLPYLVRTCPAALAGHRDPALDVVSPYGYPGLLLSEAGRNPSFATAAWAAVGESWRARGICAAFLRMHPILGAGLDLLLPPGTVQDCGATVAVDLHLDAETLWNQIGKNHRRALQKCRNLAFVASFVPLGEVLDPFLVVYEQTMDRVGAGNTYYFRREYFLALAEMPGCTCCVVRSGDSIAAACLLFESHGIVQAHLGGTSSEFFGQSPFHFCLYQAILWSKERGNRWLHLGGGVGGKDDKLMRFKAAFSPERFQFQTARVVVNEPAYVRLVELAARSTGAAPETLLKSSYFPAYRSPG